ncbi:hypothetical protein ACU686_40295 [Yinghuangia aomiensis]
MSAQRLYFLRDRGLLRQLMEHPGRGSKFSIRQLADAARCPSSTVGNLLTGAQRGCDVLTAHAIVEALGVAILVLFTPSASVDSDGSSTEILDGVA